METYSKRVQVIVDKIKTIQNKINQYQEEHSPKKHKAAFIKCKDCGSSIAVKYLKDYKCPCCYKDLRADYIIQKIYDYEVKLREEGKKLLQLKYEKGENIKDIFWNNHLHTNEVYEENFRPGKDRKLVRAISVEGYNLFDIKEKYPFIKEVKVEYEIPEKMRQ